jgi:two-component system phosphate regulon sensor histidine kinase PhoR
MKRRLLWKIYPAFLIITILSLFAISWNVKGLIRESYHDEKKQSLERIAQLSLPEFIPLFEKNDLSGIQALCRRMGSAAQIRYTLIDLLGKVLGDSEELPEKMVNHFDRPEFQQALKGQVGTQIRPSETLQQEMMYTAVPMIREGRVIAVLRTSVAMVKLQTTLQSIYGKIFQYGVIIAIVLAILSLALSWTLSHPLELLRRGAERFASGDLDHRLPVSQAREIGELAVSMNEMAAQLDERIRTIVAQKNEQRAVLASMVEGVIAVGTNGHVLSLNRAAADILQISESEAIDRTLEEVFRNNDLQHFVQEAVDSEEPAERQISLLETSGRERYLQVHATPLRDDKNSKIGLLVVLNDLTHIRQLEQVRRDFVANVSHELKTPVTSIKGFVETLLAGAIRQPQDAQRFLEIIGRQANRLNSIIDDLLVLSRIEQQAQQEPTVLEPVLLRPILAAAAELCETTATKKNIEIVIKCPDSLTVKVNDSLLEQAVVNLVDNAIKYSNPDSHIQIEVDKNEAETLIRVHDHGCGIATEHLSRLFERFYRVDKARSRKLGGTGLGLAIVKHIVQYHQGTVTVESTVNKGSTFTLHLPGAG